MTFAPRAGEQAAQVGAHREAALYYGPRWTMRRALGHANARICSTATPRKSISSAIFHPRSRPHRRP